MRVALLFAFLTFLLSSPAYSLAQGKSPFVISLHLSSTKMNECEPLYLAIRLTNGSSEVAELARNEIFSHEVGDVAFRYRPRDRDQFWRVHNFSPETVGALSPLRIKPLPVQPGEYFEVFECVVPASLRTEDDDAVWECRAEFMHRDRRLLWSDSVDVSWKTEDERRAEAIEAVNLILNAGFKREFKATEAAVVAAAGDRFESIARAAEITCLLHKVRNVPAADERESVVSKLTALVKSLAPIEREFWAEHIVYGCITDMQNQLTKNPATVAVQLDLCESLGELLSKHSACAESMRRTFPRFRASLRDRLDPSERK